MNNDNTGGPAFPTPRYERGDMYSLGMTLRDYFAAKAMQGILSHSGVYSDDSDQPPVNFDGWMFEDCAKCAYEMADAMLREREAT